MKEKKNTGVKMTIEKLQAFTTILRVSLTPNVRFLKESPSEQHSVYSVESDDMERIFYAKKIYQLGPIQERLRLIPKERRELAEHLTMIIAAYLDEIPKIYRLVKAVPPQQIADTRRYYTTAWYEAHVISQKLEGIVKQ